MIDFFSSGLFALIFTVAFGGIGLLMLLTYFRAYLQTNYSQRWPNVDGEIVTSEVLHQTSSSSHGVSSTTFEPHVEFTYSVNGQAYQGKHIGFGLTISSSTDARNVVHRYPVGATRKVFYNPHNPTEAVLERKIENSNSALLYAIVFLAVGIGACLFGGGSAIYRFITLGHL